MKFISVLIVLIAMVKICSAAEPIRLATKEWKPYQYYDPNTEDFIGTSMDVIECSFNKINVPYTVEVLPWKRAQSYVQNNRADGFFSASWNAERDKYAIRTENIANQNWTWYYLGDGKNITIDSSFKKNGLVGATLGSNIEAWLLANEYDLVTGAPTSSNLLNMLVLGRIDAFMGNELVVDKILDNFPEKNRVLKQNARSMPVGIYFSKTFLNSRPDFLTAINEAILACRAP